MSKQIDSNKIELVHRLDDMPRRDIKTILPEGYYDQRDIDLAANLIERMLDWVPSNRITCEEALRH
jgi:hypothetical protein